MEKALKHKKYNSHSISRVDGRSGKILEDNRPNSIIQKKTNQTIQRQEDETSLLPSPGTARAGLDVVNTGIGLASDVSKGKSKSEIGGRVVKLVGSSAKLGAKLYQSDSLGSTGTNIKTMGEDISGVGKTFGDKKATTTNKVVAGTRAAVSVSGNVSEVLKSFGVIENATGSQITLVSDSIKAFTYAEDLYKIIGELWSAKQTKELVDGIWAQSDKFIQLLGNVSLSVLRAIASYEALSEKEKSDYLPFMPLGKTLLNLSLTIGMGKTAYAEYQSYAQLAKHAETVKKIGRSKEKKNLLLLAHGKWDIAVKGLIDCAVGVGETIYWSGKYFPMIKGVGAVTGLSSKALKTASSAFTYFNARQYARDYSPGFLDGILVDKSKTSDKLEKNRPRLAQYLADLHNKNQPLNASILKAVGVDRAKVGTPNYLEGVVKKIV